MERLVDNISITVRRQAVLEIARIGDITEEHLDYMLDIDVKGHWRTESR
jgi:predicted phage tail protein